jgi:hypothetical protein
MEYPKEYQPDQLTPPPAMFIYDSESILLKNRTQVSSLLAQYQLGSIHSVGNCIVPQMDLVKSWNIA